MKTINVAVRSVSYEAYAVEVADDFDSDDHDAVEEVFDAGDWPVVNNEIKEWAIADMWEEER